MLVRRLCKKIVCITASIVFSSILLLSGCGLLPYYQDPKSITIEGEKYVSKFYPDLYLIGIEFREFSTSLFVEGNHHWWHLQDGTFDMYYCRHKDSLNWFPTLYCKQSQFDEVKAYYANPDNYDYYVGLYLEDKDVMLSDIDREVLESAVALITAKDNGSLKAKSVALDLYGNHYIRPTIFRQSKDGLFTTTQSEWIYYEGRLYIFNLSIGDSYYAYPVDGKIEAYMIDILNQHGLLE